MFKHRNENVVAQELVGEVYPVAQPGENNPDLYGSVELEPRGEFEVRSFQSFRLTYTAGRYGLDDSGSFKVVFRFIGDGGALQTSDPTMPNYVSAKTSNGTPLQIESNKFGNNRPRWCELLVRVFGGYLKEGDTVEVLFGDTSLGSPGMSLQTIVETGFEFKVLVDACAVGHYIPVSNTPTISIVPGPPAEWRAVLPSLRRPGETFRFGFKAEDKWGNPSDRASGRFRLETTMPVRGLPETFDYPLAEKSVIFSDLTIEEEGTLRINVYDEGDTLVARSHPLVIRKGEYSGYWGDMHGQSGESVGINTARQYFEFARDRAFLDATSHQANDFQINNTFWQYLNELSAEFYEEGSFVTFPGYEWSGNTGLGGDRNVYFRNEGCQIHRSSHALLTDRSDIETDAPTAKILFEKLTGRDCVVYAHVGGRFADIGVAHDPKLETAMEIHSAWGTFEWLLTDGFLLGHRSGVVCNSDGHKGRPGASYPGAAKFGAYGGLTCFLSHSLTRDGLFDSLRSRHHYGTTGTRMHLDVQASFQTESNLYTRNPHAFEDAKSVKTHKAMMGDIVQTDDSRVSLRVEAVAQNPIERIEIRNGTEIIKTVRGYSRDALGARIRVIWSGAKYRGRGRDTHWKGKAKFLNSKITHMVKINGWNHERLLQQHSDDTVIWDTLTTGNYGGFDAWLDEGAESVLDLTSNNGSLNLALGDIGFNDIIMDCGGLEQRLKVFRLPEMLTQREIITEIDIDLLPKGDNQLWVSVYTEDGFQAWSSPIFVYNEDPKRV